ncbi:NifU family protein [candidate division WOR-3 bacterium]|nr:NifU family protein [candidate division WOR-3 bacterium]
MREKIENVLAKDIKPLLAIDGGSIELVEVKDGIVKVRLTGACSSCPMAQLTLTSIVESKLKAEIPEIKKVEAV